MSFDLKSSSFNVALSFKDMDMTINPSLVSCVSLSLMIWIVLFSRMVDAISATAPSVNGLPPKLTSVNVVFAFRVSQIHAISFSDYQWSRTIKFHAVPVCFCLRS